MILLILACAGPPDDGATAQAVARLARASLDVRGVRPSPAEIALVEANPGMMPALVEGFLSDPRWEGRVREQYQRVLRTRSEDYLVFEREILADADAFVASVGEEPLRFVSRIAALDLPYTEMLDADWTVVDEHLAAEYPVDYPADGSGWQVAHYTDGRPPAGLLATNGMWWRYPSTTSNAHRKRANQISRVFACDDFLDNEIPFDPTIDLLDEAAVADAIANNPSCVACHHDLDPIASNLFGFSAFYDDGFHLGDATRYHPEREHAWRTRTGVAPGWFGESTTGLATLGRRVLEDDRFVDCAVEHTFRHLVGRDPEDGDRLEGHSEAFARGRLTLRALWRSVLDDPAYLDAPRKLATPDLVASQIEDLTGYRWSLGRVDAMTDESRGMLTLAGGADGVRVTDPLARPSTTASLVQARLAELASVSVVGREAGRPNRTLFELLDPARPADPAARAVQIQALHLRINSRRVANDGPEVRAGEELWVDVYRRHGRAELAWMAVLAAMLRSPEFLTY